MARIRTVKPEIALHEGLYELESETGLPIRFSWCMLFCHCDREGRFEWRPRRLGTQILPYDNIDFSRVLHALATRGFLVCYRVGDAWFGAIPTFRRHQVINNKERESEIPEIGEADEMWNPENQQDTDATGTRQARDANAMATREVKDQGEGKGTRNKEQGTGKGTEGVSPPSPSGTPAPAPNSGSNGGARHFDDFWVLYPKHREKKRARDIWIRKRLDEKADTILEDIRQRQTRDRRWVEGFIPDPCTYLNRERWEDEYEPPNSGPARKSDTFTPTGPQRWLERYQDEEAQAEDDHAKH